ncbi:hypothetical protein [Methanocaldococcus sp.]|uniref:hypothetical protein n=1 Tax=Methanocaldococcus sp. TaxID=2152917 RepID=UPI00260B2945|nr:hypothetical protein [Methanocaldococcus sp.]MCQ6253340.1 hypothetical protein [Methanocaldococcus sp.]
MNINNKCECNDDNYITIRKKMGKLKVKGHIYPQLTLPSFLSDICGKGVEIKIINKKKFIIEVLD